MATQYNSIIRIKKIDECLRNRQKVYTLPALMEAIRTELERYGKKVKVSERTVYDDLKFLKDEFGPFNAPIKRTNDRGYFYTEDGYAIFNPMQDADSIEKIKSSITALRQVANMTGYEDLKDIVLRMEASYNFEEEQRVEPIVYLEEGLNIAAQDYIEQLKTYIKQKQTISITYQPFDKPSYARIVSPYFVKEYNNRWFLFGHEHAIQSDNYEGITNISLDRIQLIKESLRTYIPKGDLNINQHLYDIIGVSLPPTPKLEIQFKLYGRRRHYVATKKIHKSQRSIEMNDDFGHFSISIIPNNEMYAHLFSFGEDLEIISPDEVRLVMKEKVEKMKKRYG